MPHYKEALNGDEEALEVVERTLQIFEATGITRFTEAAIILRLEKQASEPFWKTVADRLRPFLTDSDLEPSPSTLEDEFVNVCREKAFRLHGPKFNVRANVFGRLQEYNKVVERFSRENSCPKKKAEIALGYYMLSDVSQIHERVPDFQLGDHIMWSTWNSEDEASSDPFKPYDHPNDLPDLLGLSPLTEKEDTTKESATSAKRKPEYLIFIYKLPDHIRNEIKKPTIADAYAGSFFNIQFRPNHGSTKAIHPDSKGKPECVHDLIGAEHLLEPPSRLTDLRETSA